MYELKLTKEQKILLHLTARSLSEDPSSLLLTDEDLNGTDWKEVAKEAVAQSVPLVAFDMVTPYKDHIPEGLYEGWKNMAMSVIQTGVGVAQAQSELVKIMQENGFSYVILKGLSAAAYYPNPELRALGDVDFLIDPKQQEKVEAALQLAGYKRWEHDHVCHVVYNKPGAHLEMHFEVAGVPYGWQGDAVREFLQGAVFDPVLREQEFRDFYAPKDMYHGLILLLHMQHHMLGEGFGLRHLSDWAAYVAKTGDQPYWEETLVPFLKKIGLYTYAAVMTKVCAKFLYTSLPKWAEHAEEEACDEVMNDILTGGNFGRKNSMRAKSGMLISEHGKSGTKHGTLYNLAHGLHKVVMMQYPIIKKFPPFYPFLYAWKAVRFLFLSMIGKRPSIRKMLPEAEKRKSVYDKLAVFVAEEKK